MKITAESFIFPNAHNTSIPKKVVHRNKKKPKAVHHRMEAESNLNSMSSQVVRSEEIANILLDRKIYIEKKLFNHKYLKELAEAMGAIVKDTFDKSVTDFITDTKYGEKQVKAVANKGKRFVSPIWLTSCYQEKRYLPPIHFPYNFQKDINCLSNVHKDELDDNPFGLEEVDYDYLEANKPGNQLNLDAFVTRIPREEVEEEALLNESPLQPLPSQRELSMSQADTIPLNSNNNNEEEEMSSTLDEMQREFYYNSNNNSNNKKRRVENNEARTLRKNEIAARLNSANSSIKRINTRSNSQRSLLSTSSSVYGQPKFNVWYGEQEFKHVTSNSNNK